MAPKASKATKGASKRGKGGRKPKILKGPAHRKFSGGLAAITFVFTLILAGIGISGCQYSNSFSKSLYVAEIRRNATAGGELQLSIGYFGGCVSVGNAEGTQATNCVMNLHAIDDDDLFEELTEDLKTKPDGLQDFLNDTLDEARHLQRKVFHWALPVAHLVLFSIGSCTLFVASTNLTPKKSYAIMLSSSFLLVTFALALVFASAFGSFSSLHGLVNEKDSKISGWTFGSGNTIHFADWLYYVQVAHASMVIIFALSMAGMFVGAVGPKKGNAYSAVY